MTLLVCGLFSNCFLSLQAPQEEVPGDLLRLEAEGLCVCVAGGQMCGANEVATIKEKHSSFLHRGSGLGKARIS